MYILTGTLAAYSIENIRKERAIELASRGCSLWDPMREKDGAYAARIITAAQNVAKVTNGGNENHFVLRKVTSLRRKIRFDADS